MINWGRLITAMITPMHEDGSINYEALKNLARHLKATGTTAILSAATTGESPTISNEEKRAMFTALKETVDLPLIANIGTNYTKASIENIKVAEECGADGLLAVVPYYNKPNPESQYLHFKAIAEATDLPIMLYNVPGRTGTNMKAATTIRLSRIKNIVAVKEASGDLEQLAEIVKGTDDDFTVYTGEDAQVLPSLAVGAYGVVSVASHVVGREMTEMINSYLAGDVKRACELHLKLLEIDKRLFMTANPIPVKKALDLLGLQAGNPRLPLAPADETVTAALREELHNLGKL